MKRDLKPGSCLVQVQPHCIARTETRAEILTVLQSLDQAQQYWAQCLCCAVATSSGLGHRLYTVNSRSNLKRFPLFSPVATVFPYCDKSLDQAQRHWSQCLFCPSAVGLAKILNPVKSACRVQTLKAFSCCYRSLGQAQRRYCQYFQKVLSSPQVRPRAQRIKLSRVVFSAYESVFAAGRGQHPGESL